MIVTEERARTIEKLASALAKLRGIEVAVMGQINIEIQIVKEIGKILRIE